MLSSRKHVAWAIKPLFTALIILTSILLGSCGYTALYDQRAGTSFSVQRQMELIKIQPIKDRIGQYLHNKLLFKLNPKGKPADPRYTLNVKLEEQSSNIGVKKSAVVTRGNLKISATFTLSKIVKMKPGIDTKKLLTATVISISSYDIPQAQYAALASLKDAQARALREITENIKTRLGVYFHQNNK